METRRSSRYRAHPATVWRELIRSVGQTSTYRPPPVTEQTANGRPIYVTKDENGVFREYSTDVTSGLSELPGAAEFTTGPRVSTSILGQG